MGIEESASRLDRSVLRYVLLHESRLNMLALERALQSLRGTDERLRLAPGEVRSLNAHRIAVTFQLAAEIQLADPDVAKHFKKGELEKLCSLDFHFKEVNNRFKKLGL